MSWIELKFGFRRAAGTGMRLELPTMLNFLSNSSVFHCREVIAQRTRYVVEGPRIAIQIPTCSRHQFCLKSSFPSSSLQISKGYNVRDSAKLRFRKRRSQPSSSFFTVLPEDCSSRSNRYKCLIPVLGQKAPFFGVAVDWCVPILFVNASLLRSLNSDKIKKTI